MKSFIAQFLHQERALLLLSILASGLIFFRIFYFVEGDCSQLWDLRNCPRLRFLFLGWNLLLAWVPLGLSYVLTAVKNRTY
jgi:hypothetical protein